MKRRAKKRGVLLNIRCRTKSTNNPLGAPPRHGSAYNRRIRDGLNLKEVLVEKYNYLIKYAADEDYYVAHCLELGYVTTDGKTQEEALANIKAVALLGLELLEEDGEPYPFPYTEDQLLDRLKEMED